MMQSRLPVSVTASLTLHVGAVVLFIRLMQAGPQIQTKTISDVDLLIQTKAAPAHRVAAPSMKDFLKMALPTLPKIAQPRGLDVKLPDIQRPRLASAPKLEDKGRLQSLAKLESLDLSKRRVSAAQIGSKLEDRRASSLASLPRLEDVGMHKVRNLPQAMALEEQRQQAVALQAIHSIGGPSMRQAGGAAPAALLPEASQAPSAHLGERPASSFLPSAPSLLQPQAAIEPTVRKQIETATPAAPRRQAGALAEKKGVEIAGPLADRKVVSYEIPEFPAWAKRQGILEASVSIRFSVDREGTVLPEMRVERTSGFGALDRLAMDSLTRWKFVPIGANERQWGVITFRFVLE